MPRSHGDDLTLQILFYVAQAEREFNRQRQSEGIVATKARSVKFGGVPNSPNFSEMGKRIRRK